MHGGSPGESRPSGIGRLSGTAVYATEELEETARLFLTLYGKPVRALDDAQIEELRRVFGATW